MPGALAFVRAPATAGTVEFRDVGRSSSRSAAGRRLLALSKCGAPGALSAARLPRPRRTRAGYATSASAEADAPPEECSRIDSRRPCNASAAGEDSAASIRQSSPVTVPNMRKKFEHTLKSINWFPGHMAKGLRMIRERAGQADLFIEVRDARIPLSSINTQFETAIGQRDRIILYNKADLADSSLQKQIKESFIKNKRAKVMFGSLRRPGDNAVRGILNYAAAKALSDPILYPHFTIMVVGMPNVGKSSLINALRRVGTGKGGNVLKVAPIPGVTTSMHHRVNIFEHPPIFMIDTPGVMIPYIPDPLGALKVALTGGIHDHLADEELMSDYLLYAMNVRNNFSYVQRYDLPGPTDSIRELLTGIARRLHMLCKGGVYNFHAAAQFFLRDYRRGTFGSFTIDDVDEEAMDVYFAHTLRLSPENTPEFDKEGNCLISKTSLAKRKKALLLAKAIRKSAGKRAAS